jgi:cytochrome P450
MPAQTGASPEKVMSETAPSHDLVPRPPHVPESHVIDYDYMHPHGLDEKDVYQLIKRLHDGPDIQWTPRNGGHWIVTRAEDVRWVQENFSIFSHEVFFIPRGAVPVRMPPLTVDPPLHARYRAVLNPFFSASNIARLREKARALTIELIEGFRPHGSCEFVKDFAQVMPVIMFLGMVDLPLDRREEFVAMANGFIGATNQAGRDASLASILPYLKTMIDERYAHPGDDLLSAIAAWRDNPRYGGDHEPIGMAVLVFLGGLDTVANLLSFTARHLAQHPEHRRRIREEADIIPRAAEEYLRRFGLSNTGRLILSDVERKGVTMLADEMVLVPIGASSLDDRRYDDPFTVDFDRSGNFNSNGAPSHNTFGNGPHKCVGAPLARAELRIFLEEWLRLIPDFRLDPDHRVQTRMGGVNGIEALHLSWDV